MLVRYGQSGLEGPLPMRATAGVRQASAGVLCVVLAVVSMNTWRRRLLPLNFATADSQVWCRAERPQPARQGPTTGTPREDFVNRERGHRTDLLPPQSSA